MEDVLTPALQLLERGYAPLRLEPESKAPKHPGWQIETPTRETLQRALARPSNLGVRCGDVHADGTCLLAIDIDIDDHPLIACVQRAIGGEAVPVKKGSKGATFFVRIDHQRKTGKIKLERDGRKINAIDILCGGAQSVLPPSVHPDTKLPYRWIAGPALWDVDYRSLPVFGASLIDEIAGFCKDADDPIHGLNDMEWRGVGGGGNTHDTCVAAVFAMAKRKWADADILERIHRAKREACESAGMPYSWPEADKVIGEWIKSARTKLGTSQEAPKRPSHGMIADDFLPRARDHYRFDRDLGCWFHFDGICWRKDSGYRLRHAIDAFLPSELRNSHFISGVEMSLRDRPDLSMAQKDWDPDPHLLNTPAGIVDLKSGTVGPAMPGYHITRVTAVAPADSADGALWLDKVREWVGEDPAELAYFQKLAGLFLTGSNPEACLPMWIGPGGDGKSVISNSYRYLLGDYARTSTDTAFLETRQGQHHEEIAWLKGARLVLVNEINGSLSWNDARIKAVTGGESQAASFKGGHIFEFQPEFKLLITGNEAPSLRSVGPEFRRRFHVLKFTRPVTQPDRLLGEKLRNEADKILRWMIDGAIRYYAEGLEPSPAIKAATADYFEENDALQQFLDDRTELVREHKERCDRVYEVYQQWAEAQGFRYPLPRPKFTTKLKAKGIISKTAAIAGEKHPVRCYIGVRLTVDDAVSY